jgi:hypothetical protein
MFETFMVKFVGMCTNFKLMPSLSYLFLKNCSIASHFDHGKSSLLEIHQTEYLIHMNLGGWE